MFIFRPGSNRKASQRVYWVRSDDAENTGLSSFICRHTRSDETQTGPDETTLPGHDNFLKPGLINQASTGSDKQTGPKRPE
ncbi:hypothetical protein [Tardiphaga sp. 862_B3_N1_1]|jgi:hypothetical protein|uniref:hypothetical protein n=1 Tax=Tardiphaga sp. 862_B3_N1_1 TaxID=3240763 RepID=UPI003F8B83D6